MESQPDIFYGYLEEGVYGEFRHVPEPSPNKDKIGFIFGGKRYEFSRLAEPNKNKPESQEEIWHSWEEGAILVKEVDVMLYDGSILKNCIPQTDGDFYYKPFDRFFDIAAVKQWKYSFENLYD